MVTMASTVATVTDTTAIVDVTAATAAAAAAAVDAAAGAAAVCTATATTAATATTIAVTAITDTRAWTRDSALISRLPAPATMENEAAVAIDATTAVNVGSTRAKVGVPGQRAIPGRADRSRPRGSIIHHSRCR